MGVNANFIADFSTFIDAINQADLKLADFGKGAEKVEKQLNSMVDQFSGRRVIQEASELTIAIDKLGGVSTLTAKEMAQVGAKAQEAVEKLQKLGYEVPQGLQKLADATSAAATANQSYGASVVELGAAWVGSIATGQILADMFWKIVDVAKEVATELPKIVLAGAGFGDISDNFDHLTASAGLLGDALMGTLRAATHDTVNDMELMKVVNKDLTAGMALTRGEFDTMAKAAFDLAQAEGIDVKEALNKVNEAMLTGRTQMIGRIASTKDIQDAQEKFAASLGTTYANLDKEQQLWATRMGILDAVANSTNRLGEQTDGLDERVAQVGTAWENFQLKLGETIAKSPVLAAAFDTVKERLTAAFGGSQQDLIKNVAKLIDDGAIKLLDLADIAVTAGGKMVVGFEATKVVFGDLMQVIDGVRLSALYLEKAILAVSYPSPEVKKEFQETDDAIQKLLVSMRDRGVALQAAKAAEDGVAESEQRWHAEIDKVREAMVKARDQNVELKTAHDTLAPAVDASGAALTRWNTTVEAHAKSEDQMAAGAQKVIDAMANMRSAGVDYNATLDAMDQTTRVLIEAQLEQGASMTDLAAIYPVTASQSKAFTEEMKAQKTATDDVARIWNEYTKLVGDGAGSAYDRAAAAIDQWYDNEIAKHQAAKTDTAAFYDAIAALDVLKYQKLNQNALENDKNSKEFADRKAREDEAAYQNALAHIGSFTAEHIEKLRLQAEASKRAADTFGNSFVENAGKAKKAVEEFDASINQTAADAEKMRAAQMNTFSFAGGSQLDPKFANMSTEAKQLAGYIDLYGRVTPLGQSVGFGYSGGARAEGGPVQAGEPYLVGERGPELFVPRTSGTVVPNGGGGGVVVNAAIYVNGTAADVARQVAAELLRTVKAGVQLAGA